MEKIAHKSSTAEEAARWDIDQQVAMTAEKRQSAACELRRRVWGATVVPIRSLPQEHAARKLHR